MNNRKLGLFLALIVLVASIMACSASAGAGITPEVVIQSVQPTYTPYPTQVPPTAYPTQAPPTKAPSLGTSAVSVLNANGFHRDSQYDITDGTAYSKTSYGMIAWIFTNGDFGISAILGFVDSGSQGQVVGSVIYGVFQNSGLQTYVANGIGQLADYDIPYSLTGNYGSYHVSISDSWSDDYQDVYVHILIHPTTSGQSG